MNEEYKQMLEARFPGHKIEVVTAIDLNTLIPRMGIIVDDKKISATWNPEMIRDVKALHDVALEKEIFNVMVEEVEKELAAG